MFICQNIIFICIACDLQVFLCSIAICFVAYLYFSFPNLDMEMLIFKTGLIRLEDILCGYNLTVLFVCMRRKVNGRKT